MADGSGIFSGGAPTPQALSVAHARLVSDPTLQFDFRPPDAPGRPLQIPPFLLHLLGWLWIAALVVAAGAILFMIGRQIVAADRSRSPRRSAADTAWRPAPEAARALLEDADRLATAGAFAEAARLILRRSIDDIAARRPALVRPALTAREIAAFEALPPAARVAFASIARVVETSLFGGRPVDAAGYDACRRTYQAFALPDAWA